MSFFSLCAESPQSAFHRAGIEALVHAALLLHAVFSCCRGPVAHRTMFIWAARHEPSPLTLNDDVCSLKFASACLRKCSHAGGNGKQIFGDAWWLEPEDDARLAAELAGAHAQGLSQSAAYTAAKASLGAQGDASSHAWKCSKLRQHTTETVNLYSPHYCR